GLDVTDFPNDFVECRRHELVQLARIIACHQVGLVPTAAQVLFELLWIDSREHGGVSDLVAVQMQDRQHGTVRDRVQKFVSLPAGCQRSGLRLAVAHHTGDDQVRIVERGTIGMAQGVPKLAALMDRPRGLGCDVARNAAGKRELLEQALHARLVLRYLRVELAVAAFEIGVRDQRGSAVAWAADVDHVQLALLNDPIQVHVDKILSRCRTPMAEQPWLDLLWLERLPQQRIVIEINLADRQIIGRSPVGIDALELSIRQRAALGMDCNSGIHDRDPSDWDRSTESAQQSNPCPPAPRTRSSLIPYVLMLNLIELENTR